MGCICETTGQKKGSCGFCKMTAKDSKHTVGPWKIAGQTEFKVFSESSRTEEGYVSQYVAELVFSRADARLIAASPDLLEACTVMLAELRWLRDNKATEYDALVLDRSGFSDAWDKMKSAISKAS